VNILFIRLFLILASMFFIIFACLVGKVFVDSVVFNSVFIIINGTYSYFLLLKYLPIKLTPIEERIFQKDFKKVMDRATFRDFIRKAHLRTFSDGGQICHERNNFSGLYYVALINPNYKVVYIKKGQKYHSIKENSWIGVVEYMMYEKECLKMERLRNESQNRNEDPKKKKKLKGKVQWGLDAVVEEVPNKQTEVNYTENVNETAVENIYEEEDDPCYVYEFPLNVCN
jgi:hypothetical protein